MAFSLPVLTPSEEKADCFRLQSLIVDGGSLVLRHKFDILFPPNNLQNALNDNDIRGKLNKLFNKRILSKAQWDKLFPAAGRPCSAEFDVSLLTCLLRYICDLDEQSPSWTGIPPSFNISTEADINRLKQYRNEVSHLQSVSLNKSDFQRKWDEVVQIITRLGKDVPNLQQEIRNLKHKSIDPVKEKYYIDKIDEWKRMDGNLKEELTVLKSDVHSNKETLEELMAERERQQKDIERVEQRLHAIQANFADEDETECLYVRDRFAAANIKSTDIEDLYFDDSERDDIYVTTETHKFAREKFDRTWCLILSGLPGEGKTTMATKLVSETTKKGLARKLNCPSQWEKIPLNKEEPMTIFIDDIFGAGALDEKLVEGWSRLLPDIDKAIKSKAVKAVITTRHYIFKEAKERLKYLKIMSDDNVHTLASHNLLDDERPEILKRHLIHSKREHDIKFLMDCDYKYVRSSHASRIPYDFQYFNSMIGFPEIVSLFVKNDHLFSQGSSFFEKPYLFFKKCIEEIFLDKQKLLALILVWTSPNKKLKIEEVEPPELSDAIKETVVKFGFKQCSLTAESIQESLQYHEDGFLLKDSHYGTLGFSHNSVKDMVGLVAGQKYKRSVLQFADSQFLKQFVTTEKEKDDGLHIFIEHFRYKDLNNAVCKVMNPREIHEKVYFLDDKLREKFSPPYSKKYILSVETSFLELECFKQENFVKIFCESEEGNYMLSQPVGMLPINCFDKYCDLKFKEEVALYLPTLALLYDRPLLIKEVFIRRNQMIKTTDFLQSSLLISSQMGFKNVIELLLNQSTISVNEDAIFLASANGRSECLEYLLQNFTGNCSECPQSINGNSPLIAAAKCGEVKCIHSLINHGADVNYRNKNHWSALDKAVMYSVPESCKVLLDSKADFCSRTNKYKRTPLHISADTGDDTITNMLLQHGLSPTVKDYRGHYPVHYAAFHGYEDIVDILLKADKAGITQKQRVSYGKKSTIKGATLFHIAVLKQSVELIEVLLGNNLSPNVRDFYGRTPLYLAVYGIEKKKETGRRVRIRMLEEMKLREKKQQYEVVKKLSEYSDAHIADNDGYTPLHAAVHKGQIELVKLLAPISDVNAQDKYGKTPLHTACDKIDYQIFQILVEVYNADYCIRTKSGQTIFDILAKRTQWKNIRRRYQNNQRVTKYMVEYPRFQSFRKVVEMKDNAFAEEATKDLVLSKHPRDDLFTECNIDSLEIYSYLDRRDTDFDKQNEEEIYNRT